MPAPAGSSEPRRLAGAYATLIVRLRWWVIVFWTTIAIASLAVLPSLSEAGGNDGLRGLLPDDIAAVETEIRSVQTFGFPLLGRTVLVQRDPDGLSVYAQARTGTHAAAVTRGAYEVGPLLGAVPLSNVFGLFPASRERGTTALTYLFFAPGETFSAQLRTARRYADRFFTERDQVVGVTGSVPARAQQGRIIRDSLPLLELTTVGAIVLIVGLNFGSLVAPLVTLATAGVGYALTLRLSGYVTEVFDVTSPSELEPVVIALLLGVVTDYVVFFCSAHRQELIAGADRLPAARAATAQFAPIIGVAGLAVAGGTASLAVAESTFFRALGPALVFTVVVALLVAITLVPALMAVLGRFVYWPSYPRPSASEDADAAGAAAPAARFSLITHITRSRTTAALVVAGCTTVLLLAAVPLFRLELGASFVGSLPPDASVREAAAAARAGFADGILSPTEVLVEGAGVTSERSQLRRLGELLEDQPGVAGVLGPGDQPLRRETGILLATDGSAARYLLVLEDESLGAAAVDTIDRLDSRLEALVADSGLTGVTAGLAGDSAAATFIVSQTEQDLVRIAVAAFLINLVMLVLFLKALVAALYLLLASVLSLGASLGLTTLVFDLINPGDGLTFYVPFAAAVLLLAFGSDYNIFGVGHVWDEARHRRLPDAISTAMPQTTRAITAAGLALAASFGLLAVVPLQPFRQLAFVLCVGILLDVFVVRSLLMPALLTLFGSISAWPSRLLRPRPDGRSP